MLSYWGDERPNFNPLVAMYKGLILHMVREVEGCTLRYFMDTRPTEVEIIRQECADFVPPKDGGGYKLVKI